SSNFAAGVSPTCSLIFDAFMNESGGRPEGARPVDAGSASSGGGSAGGGSSAAGSGSGGGAGAGVGSGGGGGGVAPPHEASASSVDIAASFRARRVPITSASFVEGRGGPRVSPRLRSI